MADVKILEKARTSFFQDDDLIFINQNNALRQVPARIMAEKVGGLVPEATTELAGLMTAQDKETLDKLNSRHVAGIIPAYKLDYAGRTAAGVAADLLTYIKDLPGGATRKINLGVGNVAAFVGYWNNNDDTTTLIAGEWSALEVIGACNDNDKVYAKLRLTNYNTNKTYESILNASVFTPWVEMANIDQIYDIQKDCVKDLSISGQVITYIKGDGTPGTITIPAGAGANSYITESVVNSDGSWYRQYSDGWLEQGGKCSGREYITVNLLKPYINTNYIVLKSFNTTIETPDSTQFIGAYVQAYSKTNTSFKTYDNNNTAWYACGMGV